MPKGDRRSETTDSGPNTYGVVRYVAVIGTVSVSSNRSFGRYTGNRPDGWRKLPDHSFNFRSVFPSSVDIYPESVTMSVNQLPTIPRFDEEFVS